MSTIENCPRRADERIPGVRDDLHERTLAEPVTTGREPVRGVPRVRGNDIDETFSCRHRHRLGRRHRWSVKGGIVASLCGGAFGAVDDEGSALGGVA